MAVRVHPTENSELASTDHAGIQVGESLESSALRWSLIAAVNDNAVLETSLLKSPDIVSATDVLLKRGFATAGRAYNSGLTECRGDIAVFAHQDVYLPAGWIAALEEQIRLVDRIDSEWAVLGVYGLDVAGQPRGHVYSTGLRRVLGAPQAVPVAAISIDEMVIVIRTQSGLRFDQELPGFHLYGTDICLEANRRGRSCFVISNFCVHNSNGLDMLPLSFWRSYLFLRSKWRHRLPVMTPCATIQANGVCIGLDVGYRLLNKAMRSASPGRRVSDPARLARILMK